MSDTIWLNSVKRGLHGVWSHPDPFEVLKEIDYETAGKKVDGVQMTIWQIMRHMQEWGWIMFNRIQGRPMKGPDEESNFFPKETAPASEDSWNANILSFVALGEETEKLLLSDFEPGQTIPEFDNLTFADALMILVTHNAYHTAQIVMILKSLGKWKS
jgi:uncharacterized damage-inducible protein DinB